MQEIESAGIPVVQVASIIDIAKMVGVSRLIRGTNLCSPLSDYKLSEDGEKEMRKRYVEKALDMLQKPGQKGEFESV